MYTAIMYALIDTGEEGEGHFRICELSKDGWADLDIAEDAVTTKGTPTWENWSDTITFGELMRRIKALTA